MLGEQNEAYDIYQDEQCFKNSQQKYYESLSLMIRQIKEKIKQVISEEKTHTFARSQKKSCWLSLAYYLQVISDQETFYSVESHGIITMPLAPCKFGLSQVCHTNCHSCRPRCSVQNDYCFACFRNYMFSRLQFQSLLRKIVHKNKPSAFILQEKQNK